MIPFIPHLRMDNTQHDTLYTNIRRNTKCPEKSYIAAKDGRKRGKQGFRDTKAIFCLLGKLPNPHRTLPAASSCASVPDALTAVPAKEKSPVQHEHCARTAPDIPSSTILFIFFFLPHFLLMHLLFFLLVLF